MVATLDPTTLAVVWGGFQDAARLMGAALRRTAYSLPVREGDDFSTAIFDSEGRLIAQGEFSPGHLGAMPFTVRHVIGVIDGRTLESGDAFVVNDPYAGSGHLPDIFLVSPVMGDAGLVGWAANGTHHADLGGSGVGSQAAEGVTELYQEGLIIPAVQLFRAGRPDDALLRLILKNSRAPEKVHGDLLAQLQANSAGARRLLELIDAHGLETVRQCMTEVTDRSEAAVRDGLRTIPDGTYGFELQLDDFGRGTPSIPLKVAITMQSDEVIVDFTGSSPQVEGGINCALNYTWAYTLCALRALAAPKVPQNEGCYRPITLIAPEGSYFNPRPPAAVGGRQVASVRIFELIMGALFSAVPDRVMASLGDMSNPIFSGELEDGSAFVYYDLVIGGLGATSSHDGLEAVVGPHNPQNIPIEVQEAANPVRIERFELVADTGGAGRRRGALAVRRDVRVLGRGVRLFTLGERHAHAGFGLSGGESGALGQTILNPDTAERSNLHPKARYRFADGDLVVSFQTPGGGGFGPAHERDPKSVRRDVIEERVSREAAERRYGVILTGPSARIDTKGTARVRKQMESASSHPEAAPDGPLQ